MEITYRTRDIKTIRNSLAYKYRTFYVTSNACRNVDKVKFFNKAKNG